MSDFWFERMKNVKKRFKKTIFHHKRMLKKIVIKNGLKTRIFIPKIGTMSHWYMLRFCLCFKWRHFRTGGRTCTMYLYSSTICLYFPLYLSRWHYIVMKEREIRWWTRLIYCSAWVWHAIKTFFLFHHHRHQH